MEVLSRTTDVSSTAIQLINSGFMPHGHCYLWKPGLVWLHVGSDSLIGLSYFSIPIALILFANERKEAPFRNFLLLFGTFICLSGLTHVLAVYTVWQGSYWFSGFVKLATAIVSAITAFVVLRSLPAALQVPLPREFRKVTRKLQVESRDRLCAEKRLESRVNEQTKHLWESDSRWKLLTEFIYSAVWLCDEKGHVNQAMPSWERFTGQAFEEYRGEGWLLAYLDSDREALMACWQGSVADGSVMEFEAHLWSKEKKKHVPVQSKGIPIKDKNGSVLEWMGVIYDLSEFKQQEITLAGYTRRLQAKNKYLQEFARAASHDLREPLRKIQAYGDILKEDFLPVLPKEGRDCVGVMQNAAVRMSTLIDELLAYSRASSVDLKIEKVNLNRSLDQVEEDLEVSIAESEATIERGSLISVDADAVHLQRILQNLIGNAVKYRSKDRSPVVTISSRIVSNSYLDVPLATRASKHYCEIEVKDNGIGFDVRHSDKILKPFQRLHNRDDYPGTGMGLAICHRVVERHNGYILIESQPGVGSAFRIFLPVII